MEKVTESFLKYQQAAKEWFMKWEEKQWKRESEMEERRRKQDQEHDMRMLEMLGWFMQPRYPYSGSGQSFDPYNTYDTPEMWNKLRENPYQYYKSHENHISTTSHTHYVWMSNEIRGSYDKIITTKVYREKYHSFVVFGIVICAALL